MAETRANQTIKLVHVLAEDIKKEPKEVMSMDLGGNDFSGMMGEVLELATKKYPGLKVQSDLAVKINDGKAFIAGLVNIDHPALGHSEVDMELKLANSSEPGVIKVENAKINKNLSTRVKILATTQGVDIEEEINQRLHDPQTAIRELMRGELDKEGVFLDNFGLEFKGDKLVMGISGRPLAD